MSNVTYPIVETFSSIQGEGCLMGTPATFIRLAGCNLSCPWCDTSESWSANFPHQTVEELVAKCDRTLVVITGGEPLLYDLKPLLEALVEEGHYVAIETNGTQTIPEDINSLLFWVASAPKPQSDYELKVFPNELKFVMHPEAKDEILEAVRRVAPKGKAAGKVAIWLQPEGSNWKENLKLCYQVAMDNPGLNLRVGLQLHKIVEVK